MNIRQLLEQDRRPFASHPRVDRYFPAAAIEDARARLTRSIQRGDGPGLVVGSAGTGKSLLLQALAAQYQDQFDVVLLACSQICTRRALLQSILFELGLPYRQRDEGQLRLALLDQLLSDQQSPGGLLLLVDEAQTLSVVLLEELRMMTNLVRGGMPRVRLVLAGAPPLEETFAGSELESFSQRLAARCYLGPLGRDETIQYVRAQLAASGAEPDALFAPDAWDAIVEATDGVPRLVNQLCDRAMLAADAEGRSRVDRQIVQTAWSDLQQLPTPWNTPAASSSPDQPHDVVEFGSLSNVDADTPLETSDEPPSAEPITAIGDADEGLSDAAPIEFAVGQSAESAAPLPVDAGIDAAEETSVDERAGGGIVAKQHSGAGLWSGSGPRVYAGDADDSDNPFDEQFDEEEIVLDNFVAWDEMWLERMPQVQNLRDPQFAARVQDTLDALAAPSPGAPVTSSGGDGRAEEPLPEELPVDAATEVESPVVANEEPTESTDDNWPPLRLAIVSEAASLRPVPLVKSTSPGVLTAIAAFDPVMPEADGLEFCGDVAAHTKARAAASVVVQPGAPAQSSQRDVAETPILVIEADSDELAPTMPPVRRQEYRQLFSRLRGG